MDAIDISKLNIAFAKEVETWEGTPYVEQQSSRYGCDCVGLLIGAAIELGYDFSMFDNPARKRNAIDEDLIDRLSLCCSPIEIPIVGSILTFKIGDHVQHCAVQVENNLIVHGLRQRKMICKTNLPQNLSDRLYQIYQIDWAKAKELK